MWVCPQCRLEVPEGRFCPMDGSPLYSRTGDVPGLELERELGRGLTGTVWRAHDAAGRPVAVKVLHREWAEHPEMRERFEREARAASVVGHPGVVAPLALGALADGRPYIVMELVDGPSLEEVLALGPLPEPRAVELGGQLADALAACHRAGVIHRDVKPGNIRIGRDGRARLLDFGVARQVDIDEPRLTQGGLAVGTPHYMSPEQCTGEVVTGRADVYALGCVLYRMLSGAVPFEGAAVAVMLAHAVREPARLAERASVSPAIADLVMRCLAKRAGDRPDAGELADALRGGLAPATQVRFGRAQTIPSDPELDSVPAPVPVPVPVPLPLLDLDDDTSQLPRVRRPTRWGRWLAAAVAFAIAILAFDVPARVERMIRQRPASAGSGAMPAEDLPSPPAAWHRYLVASDAGIMLRVGTPARIRLGVELELTVEAWDAEGEPLDTTDLVVTFAGPDGAVVGFAAEPDREPGLYRVRTRFDEPGPWVLRVFPPHADAMVTFHLDVDGAIAPR
jgi:serine/threonine protein kinase